MTPPPNLDTLPAEVLGEILFFVDRNSLVSLKRVSRAFLTLDDRPLWENLLLTLPRYYGALPLICPHAQHQLRVKNRAYNPYLLEETEEYLAWAKKEADSSSCRMEIALREKVKQILKAADTLAWRKVKTITMTPRVGSIHLMLLVLDYVQDSLQSLTIDASPLTPFPTEFREYLPSHRFDRNPFDFHLSLASLTRITLRSLSSCDGDFLLQLIYLAPNLESLDVTFDGGNEEPFEEEDDFYSFQGLVGTRIHRIRAFWDARAEVDDYPAMQIVFRILSVSPEIRQIVLNCDEIDDDTAYMLIEATHRVASLQDLRWPHCGGRGMSLPRLRRFVTYGDLEDVLDSLCEAPSLEVLYIDSFLPLLPSLLSMINSTNPAISVKLSQDIANPLRLYPLLHTIRPLAQSSRTDDIAIFDKLDELDKSHQSEVIAVTSIQCGSYELVQLPIPQWAQTNDRFESKIDVPSDSPDDTLALRNPIDPSIGVRGSRDLVQGVSRGQPNATICTFADYRGKSVPSHIIQRMREVAGDSVEDWDRRGVMVGQDVWKVLEDWYAALAVAEVEGDQGEEILTG